jgi:hypothetical protein
VLLTTWFSRNKLSNIRRNSTNLGQFLTPLLTSKKKKKKDEDPNTMTAP